jgi:hypothetical protein
VSGVVYLVKVEVSPESETAWDGWNTMQHVPDVLREPGFVRATKWKVDGAAKDGWSEYWIQYELSSREALETYLNGDAVKRLRADQIARFGPSVRLSRAILLPVATVEKPAR